MLTCCRDAAALLPPQLSNGALSRSHKPPLTSPLAASLSRGLRYRYGTWFLRFRNLSLRFTFLLPPPLQQKAAGYTTPKVTVSVVDSEGRILSAQRDSKPASSVNGKCRAAVMLRCAVAPQAAYITGAVRCSWGYHCRRRTRAACMSSLRLR